MILLLDAGILSRLCHPRKQQGHPDLDWLEKVMRRNRCGVPEIADYELRRKLLHLLRKGQASSKSLKRLDELTSLLDYHPLDTASMRLAAELWAQARAAGLPTAAENSLDGDVILAAQAIRVGATVITGNPKHLRRFVPAYDWTALGSSEKTP